MNNPHKLREWTSESMWPECGSGAVKRRRRHRAACGRQLPNVVMPRPVRSIASVGDDRQRPCAPPLPRASRSTTRRTDQVLYIATSLNCKSSLQLQTHTRFEVVHSRFHWANSLVSPKHIARVPAENVCPRPPSHAHILLTLTIASFSFAWDSRQCPSAPRQPL